MIPFRFFVDMKKYSKSAQNQLMLLYLFKILRLKKMKDLLEPRTFNSLVKIYYANK